MTFAVIQSLARRHLSEGKSQAEKTISVPAMKRKYVQKPSNISENLWQNLSENEMKVLINFEQGFIAFNDLLESFNVLFEQTQTKPEKGTEFKLNVTMETFPFVNDLKTRRKTRDYRIC